MRLIDVDALIDEAIERYCKECGRRKGIKNGKYRIVYEIGDAPCRACGTGDMIDELENAPEIDAVPVVRGKWNWDFADNGWADWTCSICGWKKNTDIHVNLGYNYCPNCGAFMQKEGDRNE